MLYIGIDLGTSAVKLLLVDARGEICATAARDYPVVYPCPGWAEQDPALWWNAVLDGLCELLDGRDPAQVAGIGVGGQMHGLVALDENDEVIRPAILWNDGRTAPETAYLNTEIGRKTLSAETANIAFAGFTAPKLLWLKKHEPAHFERIRKIMLPKDYIVYRLTGVHATDYSDASGTLLLDVKNKRWSEKMLAICGLDKGQLPTLHESYEKIGVVTAEIANRFGLGAVAVAAGAGDNAAAAVGTGTVGDGQCNISVGTSGTVFISSREFAMDPNNALHAFCHADGRYHLMGCMLSAASCNQWWLKNILETDDYTAEQNRIDIGKLGKNHVFFLPYLMGERSPINDTNARGTLIGMTADTTRGDILLAVFEGVAFAIRDSLEKAREIGLSVTESNLCGGGAKSELWRTVFANVLGVRLRLPRTEQGPGYGAALLAAVACGEYASVADACAATAAVAETVEPSPALTALYEKKYRQFKKIYPALKDVFAGMNTEDI